MEVQSLGYATDLAILELGGSVIERRDGYWKISSPHAPTYYWGNFLLIDTLEGPIEANRWHEQFAQEFPAARHFALGIDDPTSRVEIASGFAELGDEVEMSTVLTCSPKDLSTVNCDGVTVRTFDGADWGQSLDLGVATRGEGFAEGPYRTFFSHYLAMQRSIVERSRGAWFGVFVADELVAQCGVIDCGGGVARYQMVSTHPDVRRRGFASCLVSAAGQMSADLFSTKTLVIVADPSYHAIAMYRDLGFRETEQKLSIERVASVDSSSEPRLQGE